VSPELPTTRSSAGLKSPTSAADGDDEMTEVVDLTVVEELYKSNPVGLVGPIAGKAPSFFNSWN
jgi:hypothetical protein